MGCCNLNNSSLSQVKVNPENEKRNSVQQQYNSAIGECERKEYKRALEILQNVKKQCRDFPFIDKNIEQCIKLIQAKSHYDTGESLFKRGQWANALGHFEEVERNQKNFLLTKQKIDNCSYHIVEDKKANQIKMKNEEEHRKLLLQNKKLLEDFQKALLEKKEQLAKVQRLEQELKKYKQLVEESNSKKQVVSSQIGEIPTSSCEIKVKGKIEKIAIYFICTKKPKCKELNENQVFNHSKCGTTSFFHADGTISCMNQSCSKYTIKTALFYCKTNTVCQENEDPSLNQGDFEKIQDMAYLADFVGDCLNKDNHEEQDQDDFRLSCGGAALSLL